MAEGSIQLTESPAALPTERPAAPAAETQNVQPAKPLAETVEKDPSARFRGGGTSFKAKLIGIDNVVESRGDKMCQESILKLKAAVKASGEHKTKIVINVSLDGLKIINLMTAQVMHEHRVDRISFIARDLTDRRAFGYVFGAGEGKHQFFGIKTAKVAEHLVLALRDLFQVVYDLKKKEMETAKKQAESEATQGEAVYAVPNNRPVRQPEGNLMQQDGGLVALEQQLQNMHQMSDLDAFKNPWPENTPTSPDTPSTVTDADMFGMANLSDISSLSSDFSLASMSSLATDSSRPIDNKTRLLDARSTQAQHFRRTSSGKSAVSWNGSTSHHWSGILTRKKRHGSLSASQTKELDEPPHENHTTTEEVLEQASTDNTDNTSAEQKLQPPPGTDAKSDNADFKSATITIENNAEVEKASKIAENERNGTINNKNTDDSFFNEVMAATGISSPTTTQSFSIPTPNQSTMTLPSTLEEKYHVRKTSDTMNDVSGSLSSISSTSSKPSTPRKSLSISNLFFSKSDKNKSSLKRKKKFLSRQSSGASVASVTDKAHTTTTNTLSDCRSSGSIENTATVSSNSSLNSSHIHRKSSSSSTASIDRVAHPPLTRGYSTASIASAPETTRSDSMTSHERAPPPASAARPRPRAIRTSQKSNSDSRNPPMFKTKGKGTSNSEEDLKHNSQTSLDSPLSGSSLTFPSSTIIEQNENVNMEGETEKQPGNSWACFDDASSASKDDSSVVDPIWGNSQGKPSEDSQSTAQDTAWSAFDEKSENVPEVQIEHNDEIHNEDNTSAFPSSKDPFSDDPFSEVDPFSTPQESALFAKSPFENEDPFGEITLEDPLADPFQDYEALFGNISPQQKTETKPAEISQADEDIFQWVGEPPTSPVSVNDNIETTTEVTVTISKMNDRPRSMCSDASSGRPLSLSTSPYHGTSDSLSSPVHNELTPESYEDTWISAKSDIDSDSTKTPWSISDASTVALPSLEFTPASPTSPPPIPPRPPQRNSSPCDAVDELPPSMPPPPLPPRSELTIASDSDFSVDQSSEESDSLYALPPDCAPPELPPSMDLALPPAEDPPPLIPSRNISRKASSTADNISSQLSSEESPFNNTLINEQQELQGSSFCIPLLDPPPQVKRRSSREKRLLIKAVSDVSRLTANSQCDDHSSNSSLSNSSNPCDPDGYLASGSASDSSHLTSSARNNSYTNDLAALSMDALQPAANDGAKLTKDQILAGFGQGVPTGGMYQQQPQNPTGFFQPQQPAYSAPQQPIYRPTAPPQVANPFGGGFGGAPREQAPMGMFPPGPSPAVPARPGAMRPPVAVPAQTGAAQNPFGDAFGSSGATSDGLLAPVNSQPNLANGNQQGEAKKANDPFASLVPDIGSSATNKKDMFKNFQMAKPPQPPPRSGDKSNDAVSPNFDNYLLNTVGGVPVPLDEVNNNPVNVNAPKPAPRSVSQDAFAPNPAMPAASNNEDPFGMFGGGNFDQPFNFTGQQQQNSNSQSLFG